MSRKRKNKLPVDPNQAAKYIVDKMIEKSERQTPKSREDEEWEEVERRHQEDLKLPREQWRTRAQLLQEVWRERANSPIMKERRYDQVPEELQQIISDYERRVKLICVTGKSAALEYLNAFTGFMAEVYPYVKPKL